jgi:hypothetical protein
MHKFVISASCRSPTHLTMAITMTPSKTVATVMEIDFNIVNFIGINGEEES